MRKLRSRPTMAWSNWRIPCPRSHPKLPKLQGGTECSEYRNDSNGVVCLWQGRRGVLRLSSSHNINPQSINNHPWFFLSCRRGYLSSALPLLECIECGSSVMPHRSSRPSRSFLPKIPSQGNFIRTILRSFCVFFFFLFASDAVALAVPIQPASIPSTMNPPLAHGARKIDESSRSSSSSPSMMKERPREKPSKSNINSRLNSNSISNASKGKREIVRRPGIVDDVELMKIFIVSQDL